MATSGSCSTSKYNDKKWVNFNWKRESYINNVSECKSSISFEIKGAGESGYHYAGPINVYINKTSGEPNFTFWKDRGQLEDGTLVGSGKFDIVHEADGTGSFSVKIEAAIYSNSINCSGSGSWDLDTLPRYATVKQSLNSKNINSITMDWSSDSTIDYIWYSKDNGSNWTGVDVSDGTSGSYKISGLSANTTYKVKTRVRRKDSQSTTDTSSLEITTYDIARISGANDFNLGDTETVNFSNPSGNKIKLSIQDSIGSKFYCNDRVVSGTNYTFNFTDSELDTLYKAMGNSNSLSARVYLKTFYDEISHYMDYKDIRISLTGNQKTGYVNIDGQWKRSKKWINVQGRWKRCVRWININGTWKRCI